MSADGNRVCIIKYQESVIVRGIEKKIAEKRYDVCSYDSEDISGIKAEYKKSDLFILYLQNDAAAKEDSIFFKGLGRLLTDISSVDKKALVIGDEDDRSTVSESVPAMWSHIWINRPLDINALFKEIKEQLQDEDDIYANKHILIVDDDPVYAKTVRGWLKDDYRVDIVTAGMQAITFLSRKKVDLVLLDYEMPITDGPQVLEMFRQEPTLADIPVIFLTGIDSRDAVARAAHLRPDGYLLKSTSKGDIMMYLKSVFKKYADKKCELE